MKEINKYRKSKFSVKYFGFLSCIRFRKKNNLNPTQSLYLHVNQKSNDDDDDDRKGQKQSWTELPLFGEEPTFKDLCKHIALNEDFLLA